jgi:hypothetical protein
MMILLALSCGFPAIFISLVALNLLVAFFALCGIYIETILVWALGLFALMAFYELCVSYPSFVISMLMLSAFLYIIVRYWDQINTAYHWAIDYDDDE